MSRWFFKKRQEYIKRLLSKYGKVTRQDLIDKFDVGSATATRDITHYKSNNNDIEYDVSNKCYVRTK